MAKPQQSERRTVTTAAARGAADVLMNCFRVPCAGVDTGRGDHSSG